jgi:hypothetical protein
MVAHRIADPRVLRVIRQWLKAGILESGAWQELEQGTPQGAGISPLLANIFLHYVLDLWVHRWRQRIARGRVTIVRFADDFVMGFQRAQDGRRMVADLKERMAKFKLTLHEEKTRLIEFGRLPAIDHKRRGEWRLPTFAFLGFTHYCGWARDGRFVMKRKTQGKRLTAKLKSLRVEARRRMHTSVSDQHRWLCQVLRGHYEYFGVPSNFRSLAAFHRETRLLWFRALRRRSQRRLTWDGYQESACALRSAPASNHSSLCRVASDSGYLREEPYAGKPHVRICEGEAVWLSYSTTVGSAQYRTQCRRRLTFS